MRRLTSYARIKECIEVFRCADAQTKRDFDRGHDSPIGDLGKSLDARHTAAMYLSWAVVAYDNELRYHAEVKRDAKKRAKELAQKPGNVAHRTGG